MASQRLKPIDGDRLRRVLASHGVTPYAASLKIGFSRAYLAQCCITGNIATPAAMLLEREYGILYEDYAPQDDPELDEVEIAPEEEVVTEVVESIPAPIPLTKDDIYRAVMDANQASIEIFLHKLAVMCQKGDRNTRGPLYDTFQAAVFYGLQGVWLNQKDNIETMLANAIRSALRTNGRV